MKIHFRLYKKHQFNFLSKKYLSTQIKTESPSSQNVTTLATPPRTSSVNVTTLPSNLTVATSGSILPAVSISWRIPAGSRFEDPWNIGASHFLRQALFSGNERESGLAIARKSELRGANLSITSDRESIIINAECSNDESAGVIESISNMIQFMKLENYQLKEIKEKVGFEVEVAKADPEFLLWNTAFGLAFRSGLAYSPVALEGCSEFSTEKISNFLSNSLKKSGHIVAASGLDQLELSEILRTKFNSMVAKLNFANSPLKYHGGEARIPYSGEDGKNHVFIGFGTSGLANNIESKVADILASLIGGGSSIQYGRNCTHMERLYKLMDKDQQPPITIKSSTVKYADGGLLGIQISAPIEFELRPFLEAICKDLHSISSINKEVIERSKSRVAFELANSLESRINQVNFISKQLLVRNSPNDLHRELKDIQDITATEFKNQSSKILSRKPVFIALGNLRSIPYSDEISFQ